MKFPLVAKPVQARGPDGSTVCCIRRESLYICACFRPSTVVRSQISKSRSNGSRVVLLGWTSSSSYQISSRKRNCSGHLEVMIFAHVAAARCDGLQLDPMALSVKGDSGRKLNAPEV